jgi:hypothetical protein
MRQIHEVKLKDKARIMAVGGGMLDFPRNENKNKLHQEWLVACGMRRRLSNSILERQWMNGETCARLDICTMSFLKQMKRSRTSKLLDMIFTALWPALRLKCTASTVLGVSPDGLGGLQKGVTNVLCLRLLLAF